MSENHIIRIPIARKDAFTAPIIKIYMLKDEMHIPKEAMERKMKELEGIQEPYRLEDEPVNGHLTSFKTGDFYCYTFHPKEKKSEKHIMYFCGGAFFQEATKYHLRFMETLAKRAGVKVTMLAYPKVPTFEAWMTYQMAEEAYRKILEETEAENIIISGDSSGGSIALTLPQYLRSKELSGPGGIIVYSPACSIRKNCPECDLYQKKDPLIILDSVKVPVRIWRKSARDIVFDPMDIDISTLPEILMFSGSEEVLYPDMKNFVEKVNADGGKIKHYIYEGMYHDFHIQYMTIAAKDAMKKTIDFICDSE